MKRAINQLIEKELKGVDVYNHNGSTWFIFTEEKRWVFEYTKEEILWYNYSLFNNLFNFVSLDVTENTEYITDWFTKNILNKPLWVCGDKFVMEKGVINIIENGVKETEGVVGRNIPIVDRVLENGVKNIWTNEIPNEYNWSEDFDREVEDTIQNGVKNTTGAEFTTNVVVENTIQNGVKLISELDDAQLIEIKDTIKNGVKYTLQLEHDCSVKVEDTIQNGVKHTEEKVIVNLFHVEDALRHGVKQIYDDCSDNQARVNGVIKIGKKYNMNKTVKTYEEIYPLTVIQMRYGGKYVAFQTESDARVVIDTQLNEEAMYDVKGHIEKQFFGLYGVGDTLFSALDDLVVNHNSHE